MDAEQLVLAAPEALQRVIERATAAGEVERAVAASFFLGYLAGLAHPTAYDRLEQAAAILRLANDLEQPLALAKAWQGAS